MNICILIGTFRPDVAYEVMTENIALIKSHRIDLQFLADKLLENKIINERKKKEVTDRLSGRTKDERMDELLHYLMKSIEVEGKEVFDIFLEILKEYDTRLSHSIAKKLSDAYDAKIDDVDKRVSIDEGKNKNVTLLQLQLEVPVNLMYIKFIVLFTAFNGHGHEHGLR